MGRRKSLVVICSSGAVSLGEFGVYVTDGLGFCLCLTLSRGLTSINLGLIYLLSRFVSFGTQSG